MGYDMYQQDTLFKINKANIGPCLDALKNLAPIRRELRWADEPSNDEAHALTTEMDYWGWIPAFDSSGNIQDIRFHSEKLWEDFAMFEAIAPYVQKGSYIRMAGEDFTIWRWYFDGETCIEEIAQIAFPAHE